MNSWKEAPHLFCGGKFRLHINGGNDFDIVGCQPHTVFDGEMAWLFLNLSGQLVEKPVNNCKLIARPISDMSDDERNHVLKIATYAESIKTIVYAVNMNDLDQESFLYLLSIGVYPFDQNHNDIIWRYENRTTNNES